MLIENPDAFKSWLTSVLEPLCDADPEALAKYVFALVKKDKTVDVLRQGMLEQLDVFLQSETKPFVELLFKTLETQEYLTPVIPNANPPNPNVPLVLKKEGGAPAAKPGAELVLKEIIPVSTLPNLSEAINGKPKAADEPAPPPAAPTAAAAPPGTAAAPLAPQQPPPPPASLGASVAATAAKQRDHRKSDSEKEERGARRGGRHRSASRNRSRSRSWDRGGKRSRSRDRSPRPERRDRSRPWRNKSPPRGGGGGPRYERRRSRSGSPPARLRSPRSRSPPPPRHSYRGGRYRNRSPPPRSPTRSRSRSTERATAAGTAAAKDKERRGGDNSGGATPTQDSNHGDTDMRLTSTTQSIQSVVSALSNADGAAFGSAKRRCRDFDEKGYCMRGEMCPYDHGVDPVVLEDTALSRVLTFGPNGAPAVVSVEGGGGPAGGGAPPGLLHHPAAAMLAAAGAPPLHHAPHHRGAALHPAEYNPSAPAMWHHRPGFRGPRGPPPRGPPLGPGPGGPFGPLPSMQRELISVPVTDNAPAGGYKRRADAGPYHHHHHQGDHQPQAGAGQGAPPAKRKQGNFDFGRLGPRGPGGGGPGAKNPCNCSLELKKVPRGLNNITHLNNHFGKFGKIVNIQVCYDGDPEAAIVTFSSHAEANAAYRSTEAVLNNRFIKVFWHSAGDRQENVPPGSGAGGGGMHHARPVKDRLGQPVNANKVFNLVQPKAAAVAAEAEGPQQPGAPGADDSGAPADKVAAYVPSAAKLQESRALANAAIVKNQEILAAKEQLKKKHEEKRKEALKITQDLRKRKQELLEKQLAQQKLLIEKLEKTNPSGQQRELLMSTIKTVQESIESIRKDMVSSATAAVAAAAVAQQVVVAAAAVGGAGKGAVAAGVAAAGGAAVRKSKEEAQREVLDAELDLITRQQEGGDTSELQRRLLELRAQAYSLARGGARRGRGGGPPRHHALHLTKVNLVSAAGALDNGAAGPLGAGRRAAKPHTVVDHRPTRLLVSGYEADERDSVLAHFAQYGEIIDYVTDDSTPSVVLNYRTRKEAELALLKGRHFQDRTLSVTWCSGAQLGGARATSRTVLLSGGSASDVQQPAAGALAAAGGARPEDASPAPHAAPPAPASEEQLLEGDDENVLSEPLGAELSEEALLQDDEEEDDENEDRSWRR